MYSFLKSYKTIVVILILCVAAAFVGSIIISSKILYFTKAYPITSAVIQTNMGNIHIRFLKDTPKTVENFIKLSQSRFYDRTHINRIIPNFMIQAGDPLSKFLNTKQQWGNGGPGYTFGDEIHKEDLMIRGAVAMVNSGPNTNGSQFFILAQDANWLQNQNTIFAYVIDGIDVIDKISSVAVGITGIPASDIEITKIDLK